MSLDLMLNLMGADQQSGGAGAAAPLEPPAGMTGWLKLDDADAGAFPSTANAGSISANWTRSGTVITVETGGPNGMKFAFAADPGDWLLLGAGATIADFFDNNAGMCSVIVKTGLIASEAVQYQVPGPVHDAGTYMGLGIRSAGADKIVPWGWDTTEKKINLDYTAAAWAVVTVRWDGTNIYAKINAGSWQSASMGNLGAVTGVLRLLQNGAQDPGIAEMLMYSTVNSEEDGDAAHAYLRQRSAI